MSRLREWWHTTVLHHHTIRWHTHNGRTVTYRCTHTDHSGVLIRCQCGEVW